MPLGRAYTHSVQPTARPSSWEMWASISVSYDCYPAVCSHPSTFRKKLLTGRLIENDVKGNTF